MSKLSWLLSATLALAGVGCAPSPSRPMPSPVTSAAPCPRGWDEAPLQRDLTVPFAARRYWLPSGQVCAPPARLAEEEIRETP